MKVAGFGLDLQIAFFVACVVTTYWFWIRPLLKKVPAFAHFYAVTGSFWAAVKLRFQGIKGAIATVLGMAVSAVVALHDDVMPYVAQVDWTPLTQKVPNWVWPIVTFAAFYFIGKCREWSEGGYSK